MGFMMRRFALAAGLCASALLSAPAHAVRSDWASLGEGRIRILAERDAACVVRGGVEVALEPGWHTYWRYPGAAGIPPRFDFAGSENIGAVTFSYPVPERYDDGTGISLIYRDSVVFPFVAEPADPAAPVSLRLDAFLGVCREVCIPAKAVSDLGIPLDAKRDPLTSAKLESAADRIPAAAKDDLFAVETAEITAGSLRVTVIAPGNDAPDLLVEPPDGWYLDQPVLISAEGNRALFDIPLGAGVPKGETASGKSFRFLVVAGLQSVEQTIVLP